MGKLSANSQHVSVVSSFIQQQSDILSAPKTSFTKKKEAAQNIAKATNALNKIAAANKESASILSPIPSMNYAQQHLQVHKELELRKDAEIRGDLQKAGNLTSQKFAAVLTEVSKDESTTKP